MGNKEKTNTLYEDKDALLDLLKDINCFDLLKDWIYGSNIFDILGIARTEIRHSNMLAWLLNPNEKHGLDTAFLYNFIVTLSDIEGIDNKDILNLLVTDLSNVKVYREWNHIDVMITFPKAKTVIAIENKIGAHEHNSNGSDESQLITYQNVLKKHFNNFKQILIFLTPDGDEASTNDWNTLSYSDLIDDLEDAYESQKDNLGDINSILINNYIETIKKEVIMDDELVAICNEIYKKHKRAFDLIYEKRDDTTQRVSDACKDELQNLVEARTKNNTNPITIVDENCKSSIKFRTTNMKTIIGTECDISCYFYEIEIRPYNGSVRVRLKIVFHQNKQKPLDKKYITAMNLFIDNGKKLTQGNHWEWKGVTYGDALYLDDADDVEINDWLTNRLKEIDNKENEILQKLGLSVK